MYFESDQKLYTYIMVLKTEFYLERLQWFGISTSFQ